MHVFDPDRAAFDNTMLLLEAAVLLKLHAQAIAINI